MPGSSPRKMGDGFFMRKEYCEISFLTVRLSRLLQHLVVLPGKESHEDSDEGLIKFPADQSDDHSADDAGDV